MMLVWPLGCQWPMIQPASNPDLNAPPRLQSYIRSIDSYANAGRLREAINEAELALVDYYHSSLLREKLAELRSIRRILYQRDWNQAEAEIVNGKAREAQAIFKDIESYGDWEMVQKASARREEISVKTAAPKAAMFKSR
jgi:hypothetical protein